MMLNVGFPPLESSARFLLEIERASRLAVLQICARAWGESALVAAPVLVFAILSSYSIFLPAARRGVCLSTIITGTVAHPVLGLCRDRAGDRWHWFFLSFRGSESHHIRFHRGIPHIGAGFPLSAASVSWSQVCDGSAGSSLDSGRGLLRRGKPQCACRCACDRAYLPDLREWAG